MTVFCRTLFGFLLFPLFIFLIFLLFIIFIFHLFSFILVIVIYFYYFSSFLRLFSFRVYYFFLFVRVVLGVSRSVERILQAHCYLVVGNSRPSVLHLQALVVGSPSPVFPFYYFPLFLILFFFFSFLSLFLKCVSLAKLAVVDYY